MTQRGSSSSRMPAAAVVAGGGSWGWDEAGPRHQWINGRKGNRGPGQNRKDEGRYKKLMEDLKGARQENLELRQVQLEKLQEKNLEILRLQAEVDFHKVKRKDSDGLWEQLYH